MERRGQDVQWKKKEIERKTITKEKENGWRRKRKKKRTKKRKLSTVTQLTRKNKKQKK